MFVSVWNYFAGYVIVEVSGYALEKFINCALQEDIYFWDVKRESHKLYFKTSIKNFKQLKQSAKQTRCRMKIVDKCGLPFTMFRYRRRKVLASGIVLFAVILYILSSFVWLVEVEGTSRLQETDLISTLENNGFTVGKMKNKLDLREAEQCLVKNYSDIIWAGIKFEGTKLVVQVTESVPKPKMYDKSVSTHLVAKRDGLITYIATDKGIPQVQKGDTVKKGDVLVSGAITLQDDLGTVRYTHSDAKVTAKTCYTLKATMPRTKIEKQYTNHAKKNFRVRLFGTYIPLYTSGPRYTYFDTVVTLNQFKLTDLFPLPFYFEKTEYIEYVPTPVDLEMESVKDQLEGKLYDELSKQIGTEGKVLYYEINYEEDEKQITAMLNALVEEGITQEIPVTQEEMLSLQNKQEGVQP
ncbi:MAG: sporulation protein YqfD [Cellulosilyticaceae bacterium]